MSTGTRAIADGSRPVVLRARPDADNPVDRFRVESVLTEADGVRACAVVDGASDRRLTLFTCEIADGWDAWDRFAHECRVVRSLGHPSTPRWVDHGERDGRAWLLTERIEGRTLGDRIARGERFSDLKLQHVLLRALDVLAYLHELNPPVFHCDVHPGAIVASDRGELTLIGFGRSRGVLADDAERNDLIGRDGYLPVQTWRLIAGPATDFWALGATMLATASGRDASSLPRTAGALDIDACMRPSLLREQIRSLLAVDPAAVVASAERVRRELRTGR